MRGEAVEVWGADVFGSHEAVFVEGVVVGDDEDDVGFFGGGGGGCGGQERGEDEGAEEPGEEFHDGDFGWRKGVETVRGAVCLSEWRREEACVEGFPTEDAR